MNKIIKLIIFALLLSLLSSQVMSLGVGPVRNYLSFEPNLEKDFTIKIINDQGKDFQAKIEVRGDLADYINLERKRIDVKENQESIDYSFSVYLTDKLDKAGEIKGEIVITELPDEEDNSNVIATGAVIHEVIVKVPYADLYAEAEFYISDANINEEVTFTIPILNYGSVDISKASATIEIYTINNEKVTEIKTNELSIIAQKKGDLIGKWDALVKSGIYIAKAKIDYDGKEILLEKEFNLGNPHIEIFNIDIKDFILGGIAKFDISLENKWNQKMTDVFGEVRILDKKGIEKTKFKTASVDIEPYQKENITAYWETQSVTVGKYDMNLLIHYMNKVTEKIIEIQVNIDSIKTSFTPTGDVISKPSSIDKISGLKIMVYILLGLNVFWIFYFIKKKKGAKKQ